MSALRHAAVTIVSKNYFAYATTLAKSYLRQHPSHEFLIVLVDRADGYVQSPLPCGAEVIEIANFSIPDIGRFIYRYSIMELNTAVKPFVLSDLFERRGYESILYLDPDILVFQPLDEVYELLKQTSIVLIPHIRRPYFDNCRPSDLDILRSGTYNLGCLGLRKSNTSSRLLDWWRQKLYQDCVVDLGRGLFVDQKWLDLVPGFFPEHRIIYDPGYNVAYWNLHERPLSVRGGEWLAGGRPLKFFHFSGYLPASPQTLSKHQDRHLLKELPAVRSLTDAYGRLLTENGYQSSSGWPYAFETLSNGIQVPLDLVREVMQWSSRAGARTPCPLTEPDRFCHFLLAPGLVPGKPRVATIFNFLLRLRHDVARAFPNALEDTSDPAFRSWLQERGVVEYRLADLLRFEQALSRRAPCIQTSSPQANCTETFVPIIGRILDIYFQRKDLQSVIPDLATTGGATRCVRWLLENRFVLDLTDAEICAFEQFLHNSPKMIGDMQLLYSQKETRSPSEFSDSSAICSIPHRAGNDSALTRVNVAGYLRAPTGVGESARSMVTILGTLEIDMRVMYLPHPLAEYDHLPVTIPELYGWPHADAALSITIANADNSEVPKAFLSNHYWAKKNVGYWVWETEELPARFAAAAEQYDEIWTPSRYSATAIARSVDLPIRVLPHTLDFDAVASAVRDRKAFGLPEDSLLFGFAFDIQSVLERKNVRGLASAFRSAFRDDDDCYLVLKANGSPKGVYEYEMIRAEFDWDRILFLEGRLTRGETFNFLKSLDLYASLHRSEGFGLSCAEAMALGVPVIATGYSGNLDYMADSNSVLVSAKTYETDRPFGPYPAGTRWGAPDPEHAISAFRQMLSAERRAYLGRRGADSVREQLNSLEIGRTARLAINAYATPSEVKHAGASF